MALHPVPYFLLGLQWEGQGFLKLNAYTKGQVATYNSLFEQKLRQIILEIFCFPLSALLSVSCGLSLFSHHWPLHVKPHSFSLSVLVSCSSSLFHSFHILFSLDCLLFSLCSSLLVFFSSLSRSFGPLLSSSGRVSKMWFGMYLQEDTNAKQKHWVPNEARIPQPGCHWHRTRTIKFF